MDLFTVLCRYIFADAEFGQVFLSVFELNLFYKVYLCKICPFNTFYAGLFLIIFTIVSTRYIFSIDLFSCFYKISSINLGNSANSARYFLINAFYIVSAYLGIFYMIYISSVSSVSWTNSARYFLMNAFYIISAYLGTLYTIYINSISSISSARNLSVSSFYIK